MGLRTRLFRAMGFEPVRNRPRRRMYEGATVSRLTTDWIAGGTSADAEINGSITRLRNRARQLVRDSDYAKQAKRAVVSNVIGSGIKLQSQVKMQRGGKLDPAANEAIEYAWKKWGYKEHCDVAGRLCFSEIERMAIGAMCESGEIFIRLIRQPFGGSQVPFALQLIESDQLDETYTGASTVAGNEWRMGVEVDKWGRPVQYAFLAKHPGDGPFSGMPGKRHLLLPANEVIHLAILDRPGQTRGVTWFASAIKRMHHLSGYEEAEVVRARAASALMGFITSPEGELVGDDVIDGERVSNFEPGTFKYLQPGESVTVPSLDAPDGQFEPFLRAMLRATAAGIGCSYETISRDYSQTNYSSSRLALLEDRENWRSLQDYMIKNFHQPVYAAWLEMAVMSGALNLPLYEVEPDRFKRVKWVPRAWGWVDPQKEVAAYKEAVRCGFKTLGQVVGEQGGDLDEYLLARKAELEKLDELGIAVDTDPSVMNAGGSFQTAAPAGIDLPSAMEEMDVEMEDDAEEDVATEDD
jgi:lambda family phage portal protein